MKFNGEKFLIVDDEPLIVEILVELFAEAGAIVCSASSKNEALSLIEAKPFDVILSDVRMPGGDGPALVRLIPENKKRFMKLYFISGFNDLSERDLAELGILCQFSKPFDLDLIIDRILEDLKN